MTALSGRRVLVTGASGLVAFPVAAELARNNEVYAVARFSDWYEVKSGSDSASARRMRAAGSAAAMSREASESARASRAFASAIRRRCASRAALQIRFSTWVSTWGPPFRQRDPPNGTVSCKCARARVALERRDYLSRAMIFPSRDHPGVSQSPSSSPETSLNRESRGSAVGGEAAIRSWFHAPLSYRSSASRTHKPA